MPTGHGRTPPLPVADVGADAAAAPTATIESGDRYVAFAPGPEFARCGVGGMELPDIEIGEVLDEEDEEGVVNWYE